MKNIDDNMSVGGYPAVSIIDWHREQLTKKRKMNNISLNIEEIKSLIILSF